jgi:hypothetical protein
MKCQKCNSRIIRSRVNYTHGKKSGGTQKLSCKECGSTDIEQEKKSFRNSKRR